MMISTLQALSPLDGRYHDITASLKEYWSEAALMRYRLKVECLWFEALSDSKDIPELKPLAPEYRALMRKLVADFNDDSAEAIKFIEMTTNHDMKAVEYYLKSALKKAGMDETSTEFIHFGCTSEDINNLAYSLMLNDTYKQVLYPTISETITLLKKCAKNWKKSAILGHTHGQPASPTTLGKEMANFSFRLEKQFEMLQSIETPGKMNGAVGNFNAHIVAYPDKNWPAFTEGFVSDLGLHYNPMTTQIEPHDMLAAQCHQNMRIHTLLIDLSRDLWQYIAKGYFKLALKEGEVGSSTMPHKVNPIDFENAEGNFGMASAIFSHIADKCPISRLQRDLSDSTVMRNIGVGMGQAVIAYHSLAKGLDKLSVDEVRCKADLNDNCVVLAEAMQTVMRRYGIPKPYETCSELSRGQVLCPKEFADFIAKLNLPDEVKATLCALTPETYTGLAEQLVDEYG